FPVLLVAAVAAKWLAIGKVKAGRYPLWSGYYVRWWFVQSLVSSIPIDYLEGTPLLPFVYRLFGVHVGRNVQLATENIAAFDQVTIGDGSCIDDDASLLGYTVKQAQLIIGPIRIGQNCFVGTRSVLSEETEMEDNARLEDFSILIMLEVVVAKWLLVQRVKPGTYRVHGSFYIRNWLVEQLYALSLDLTAQLRATLYLAPWFKALGAKLGRNVELSTAATPTP